MSGPPTCTTRSFVRCAAGGPSSSRSGCRSWSTARDTVNRHAVTDWISFPLYFMTGMAAYGAMWGSINPGARIARDRSKGWVRALRITPLRVRTEIVASNT